MIIDEVRRLLGEAELTLDQRAEEKLGAHAELIREWNVRVSLVSQGDLERLVENHIVDSLSLAPHVQKACGESGLLLDVGSGAGFPGIPLKILMPDLPVCLVERSAKKSEFLREAVKCLGLEDAEVRFGEFPLEAGDIRPSAITGRAVEKAEKFRKAVYRYLRPGCTFLCQSGDPNDEVSSMFHVEHIVDAWKEQGYRRGNLWLVRR